MDFLLVFFFLVFLGVIGTSFYLSYLSKKRTEETIELDLPPDPMPEGPPGLPAVDIGPIIPDNPRPIDIVIPITEVQTPLDPEKDLILTVIVGHLGKGGKVLTYDQDLNFAFEDFGSLDKIPESAYFIGEVTKPQEFPAGLDALCQYARLRDRYARFYTLDYQLGQNDRTILWDIPSSQVKSGGFNWLYFDWSNLFDSPSKVVTLKKSEPLNESVLITKWVLSDINLPSKFRSCLLTTDPLCKTPIYLYSPNPQLSENSIIEPREI